MFDFKSVIYAYNPMNGDFVFVFSNLLEFELDL